MEKGKFLLGFIISFMLLISGIKAQKIDYKPKTNPPTLTNSLPASPVSQGTILDSLLLLKTRTPLGVTVAGNKIIISSSDGKGNNYFDEYDFDGNYISSYSQGTTSKWGYRDLAFDGTYILGSDSTTIEKINPTTFAPVGSITNNSNNPHRGLAYDAASNVIYSTNWNSSSHLLRINPANGATLKDFGKPLDSPYGLAFDPYTTEGNAYLWYASPGIYGKFYLERIDTANGKVNYIIDLSNKLGGNCLVGGLEIVNNIKKFPGKIVALAIEQKNKKLIYVDLTSIVSEFPVTIKQIGSFGGFDATGAIHSGMAKYGNYLYVINNSSLEIYQIDNDPANPKLVRSVPLDKPNKVFVYDDLLFVSEGGDPITTSLSIFSLSNDPTFPLFKTSFETGGPVTDAVFSGKKAFFSQFNKNASLVVIDFSVPDSIKIISTYTNKYPGVALAIDTTKSLLFESFFEETTARGEVALFDISKLPSITKVDSTDYTDVPIDLSIAANNKLMVLKNWYNLNMTSLQIYFYGNDSLKYLNSYNLNSKERATQFEIIDSCIVVTFPNGGLQTFAIDYQMKKLLEGPELAQWEAGKFIYFSVPNSSSISIKGNSIQRLTKSYLLYLINGTSYGYNRKIYGSGKTTVIKLNAPKKKTKNVLLTIAVAPQLAGQSGCTTDPAPGVHSYAVNTSLLLKAFEKKGKGWYFKEWTGGVSSNSLTAVLIMDNDKNVKANFVNLRLEVTGYQKKRLLCPCSIANYTVSMLPINLTASDDDDWEVSAITFNTSGTGNEKEDTQELKLYKGANIIARDTFTTDNQKITMKFNAPIIVPAGQTVKLTLKYHFNIDTLKYARDKVKTFLVSTGNVSAKPKHYKEGLIEGEAKEDELVIARIINVTQQKGFPAIENAFIYVNNGDSIFVCKGVYNEDHITIENKQITLFGENRDNTIIRFGYDTGFYIYEDSVTIKNFTIEYNVPNDSKTIDIFAIYNAGARITNNKLIGTNNFTTGILLRDMGIQNVLIEKNIFSGYFKKFIKNEKTNEGNIIIRSNSFDIKKSTPSPKIAIESAANIKIDSNYFINNSYQPDTLICLTKSKNIYLHSNVFDRKENAITIIKNSVGLELSRNKNAQFILQQTSHAKMHNNRLIAIDLRQTNHTQIFNNHLITIEIKTWKEKSTSSEIEIFNNTIANNSNNVGISIEDANNLLIENNRIYNNKNGIWFLRCNGIEIIKNKIFNNGLRGIEGEISKNVIIADNYIKGHLKDGGFYGRGISGFMLNNYSIHSNSLIENCTGIKLDKCKHGNLYLNNIMNSLCLFTGINLSESSPQIFYNNIFNNNGNGILATNKSQPIINFNNIAGNKVAGVNNENQNFTIDARNNYWGSSTGPGNDGFLGNVDAGNWLANPVSLALSCERDSLFVQPSTKDSLLFMVTNLADSTDVVNVTLSDNKGWLTNPKTYQIEIGDTLPESRYTFFNVPASVQSGAVDLVKIKASSQNHSGVAVFDSFWVVTYPPKLNKIFISPDSATILKGDSLFFSAFGLDQYDKPINFDIKWNASSGQIDSSGKFISDTTFSGIVEITAGDASGSKTSVTHLYVAKEKPKLVKIFLSPDSVFIRPNESAQFFARGKNQFNFPMRINPVWQATGGSITQTGYFQADTTNGTFLVIVSDTAANVSDTSVVVVKGTVSSVKETLPLHYCLSQNYPNPFNPSTTVEYSVPYTSKVRIYIFNILGQKVKILVNKIQTPGFKSLVWNAANLASGVYFLIIRATPINAKNRKPFTAVRKMILLK